MWTVNCFSYTLQYFQDLWTQRLVWRKKDYVIHPSSPLHLFIYEKETDHNSADNSAFDVYIRLTKCTHNAPKAMYSLKIVLGWTPGTRFNRRGRISEGDGRGEGRAIGATTIGTGGRRSPHLLMLWDQQFWAPILGSTKIQKCRQIVKRNTILSHWHNYPNSSAINFSLTANSCIQHSTNCKPSYPHSLLSNLIFHFVPHPTSL